MPKAMKNVYGATYSGKIWRNIMNRLHANLNDVEMEIPSDIVSMNYIGSNGQPIPNTNREYEGEPLEEGRDIFSLTLFNKVSDSIQEENERKIEDSIRAEVDKYVNHTVSDLGEYLDVDTEYQIMMNKIYVVQNQDVREELYDLVNEKYHVLLEEKEMAQDTLMLYEEQQSIAAEESEKESLEAAEKALEKSKKAAKTKNFMAAYNKLHNMNYKPDESLINDAMDALDGLYEYEDYQKNASLMTNEAK